MNKIPYQTAVITGIFAGIGKTFAYELAQKGLSLILTARSEDKLALICADLNSKQISNTNYPVDGGALLTFEIIYKNTSFNISFK